MLKTNFDDAQQRIIILKIFINFNCILGVVTFELVDVATTESDLKKLEPMKWQW